MDERIKDELKGDVPKYFTKKRLKILEFILKQIMGWKKSTERWMRQYKLGNFQW